MIEVLKQALMDAKRNERHNNVAETRYWLNQYKLIADQAIAQHPPQRTEPPDWFPAVENILKEYGLQAMDFVADFKAAMKGAEQSQRTWVGLAKEDRLCAKYMQDAPDGIEAVIDYIESKLKELNT